MIWVKFLFLLLVSVPLLLVAWRRASVFSQEPQSITTTNESRRPLIISFVISFTFLAALLSCSWIQNDEWVFAASGQNSILDRLKTAKWSLFCHVSRIGELSIYLTGLSIYRWQAALFTPLYASLAPIFLYSLIKKRDKSIYSKDGMFFYWSFFFLLLLGVYLTHWRNYWCYAAAANYLYPTVLTLYWLRWFRTDFPHRESRWSRCIFLFILGIICGWGTECMTATLLPLLTIWILYTLKNRKLPFCSYFGYVGFLWGAMLLFGSPAHSNRAAGEVASCAFDVGGMNAEQLSTFLHTLTWDSVNGLMGATGVITLRDIPIWLHYHFLPFISERFWKCCLAGAIAWILLALCTVFRGGASRWKHLVVSVCILAGGYLCAVSYLVQCIPTRMSFLPPCFIVVIACAYLYCRIPSGWAQKIFTGIVVLTGCIVFIPAGIQAASYKHLDLARIKEIETQKAQGKEDIVLKPIEVHLWWPSLGLIAPNDLKPSSDVWPNPAAAGYFGVSTIRQERAQSHSAEQK
ncbi:MAG: DUF6056 family protein [Akkermansia sp.]|nr:DUF6056 family protein [Akkermansia sp.]